MDMFFQITAGCRYPVIEAATDPLDDLLAG
jgi:hypothetical protein